MIAIRAANAQDLDAMLALMPRLAAFDLPSTRVPEHLWMHDRDLVAQWAAGDAPHCFVFVAERDAAIVGLAVATEGPELLSKAPAAHLEALAVAEGAEGLGIGARLVEQVEAEAIKRGALSITLHVFACNTRARQLYERRGYDGELMRYTKPLVED